MTDLDDAAAVDRLTAKMAPDIAEYERHQAAQKFEQHAMEQLEEHER